MESFQFHEKLLGSAAFSNGDFTIKLDQLEKTKGDYILHLVAIEIQIVCSAVTLSSGNFVPEDGHGIVKNLVFSDGTLQRFGAGLLSLREWEEYEQGGRRRPEALQIATGGTTVVRRTLHMGPQMMRGSPTDFAIPNMLLKDATLQFGLDSLTNINANLTALTATISATARCIGLKGEIRIPPVVERKQLPIATGATVAGEALVPFLFFGKSNTPLWKTAIAAGDIGNLTIGDGKGNVVQNVHSSVLADSYNQAFASHASLGYGFQGEPRDANDTYMREVNPATPTALQAQTSRVQPGLFVGPDGRISKILCQPRAALQVDYTGSAALVQAAMTRILPQSPERIGLLGKTMADAYGLKGRLAIKPLYGKNPDPYFAPYLPYSVKSH